MTSVPGAGVVFVLAVVIAGVAAIYLAVCLRLYTRVTRVSPDSSLFGLPDTPAAFTARGLDCRPFLMPDYEAVELRDRTGTVGIAGWWIPAEASAAPVVVVVHGYTSCRRDPAVLLASGMLHRNGFAVLAIDLRNHGDSGRTGGRHTGGVRESADVLGAWDWLVHERHRPAVQVGLLGISLGAATVLIAAGAEPEVAAVWADSSYGDIDEATEAEIRRNGLPGFLLPGGRLVARLLDGPGLTGTDPIHGIAAMSGRAVSITHGTADSRLDVRYADELIRAGADAGARVESWIVEGSEHTQAIFDRPAEYEQRLVDFFARALRR
jgi:fermentation-respiration switch protein FrsA (DUF1100 family)